MPRNSKDELDILEKEKINKKKAVAKETNSAKKTKSEKTVKSASASSNKSTTKKAGNKTAVKTATKNVASKKATSKTTASKKTVAKVSKAKKKSVISNVEYYDLPYSYNQTVVKILAQTPTNLFVYWDISDEDKKLYIKKYGDNFFSSTKPVLVITNKTMNYTFEVEINDYANSWYVHLNDADCDYSVELGRKPIYANSNIDNYIHISTSNDMEMPNNHILFDRLGKSVFFKNIKNNFIEEKEISSISFLKNIGKIYNIYELYKVLYKDEIELEELDKANISLHLSSSNNPSSPSFKN